MGPRISKKVATDVGNRKPTADLEPRLGQIFRAVRSHKVGPVIAEGDQARLCSTLQRDWEAEVNSDRFREICAGKERGHRIADYAEELTVGFVTRDGFRVAFESGNDGSPRARSMGDIWLASGSPEIYNPINVKAGIAGVGGQPNMVSLEKLTQALLDHAIDSYWLLLLRFTIDESATKVGTKLVNILDYMGYMHFDAGPGQIMLRSDAFYAYLELGGAPTPLSLEEAVDQLIALRRDGDSRLLTNRERRRSALELKAATFDPTLEVDQSALSLLGARP